MFSVKKSNKFHLTAFLSLFLISTALSFLFDYLKFIGIVLPLWLTSIIEPVLSVFLPVFLYYALGKSDLKKSLYLRSPGAFNLILAFLLALALIPAKVTLSYFSLFFVKSHIAESLKIERETLPFLVALLVSAVLPAIFEELSTRLVLADNYRYKPFYIACIMSGLFFGIMHGNFNQFSYTFFSGIVMCFALMITRSVYVPIMMHFTNNGFAVVMQYITPVSETTQAPNLEYLLIFSGYTLLSLPLVFGLLYWLIRRNGKLAILKQKPSVYELTVGCKISPYLPGGIDDKEEAVLQVDPDKEIAYNIYLAKNVNPFNLSFWVLFVIFFGAGLILR